VNARRFFAASTVLALALAACSREPHSVLLVTLDSTRADALGAYGARAGLTPNLDRLAVEGVVFENAHTVAPLTAVAHASILSGLYPPRHGVRDDGLGALPRSAETLAERARDAGFQTAAFPGSVVLDEGFGFEQGFEHYTPPARLFLQRSPGLPERNASDTADLALQWLGARDRGRPFFLWVHLRDPHLPYEPPDEFRTRAGDDAYRGEIAAADRALGRILDALAQEDALDDALVIAVADHGEAFDEHMERGHGALCYEPTLRVPLIARFPGKKRAGRRSSDPVSVVDVHPTVLEALAIELDDGEEEDLDGLSLFDEIDAERGVYFENYHGYFANGWHPLSGWLDERGKVLLSREPAFFDLRADPREQRDLARERPEEVERARAAIRSVAGKPALERDEAGSSFPELARSLQALGYGGSAPPPANIPDPLSVLDLPGAESRSAELVEFQRALGLVASGRYTDAEPILAALVQANPRHLAALDRLALCRMRTGRHAAAIDPLERALAGGPASAEAWTQLGACRIVTGEADKALGAFRRAVEIDPNQAQALGGIVQLLGEAGFRAKAEPFRKRFDAVQSRP
jgi:arylsulfatase A-like enzyme/Tfp pilus assembly protein PilF